MLPLVCIKMHASSMMFEPLGHLCETAAKNKSVECLQGNIIDRHVRIQPVLCTIFPSTLFSNVRAGPRSSAFYSFI